MLYLLTKLASWSRLRRSSQHSLQPVPLRPPQVPAISADPQFNSPAHQHELATLKFSDPTTSSMSSEQYEVMYTLRSEMFGKKDETPRRLGDVRDFGPRGWVMDVAPAERDVFIKYRQKGKRRAAVGGLVGASAMAGVWKMAQLGRAAGVTGMIVGGVVGAGVSMRTSGIRSELFCELLQLPSDKAPHAAQAREILQTKLSHNTYAQELLQKAKVAKEF